MHVFLISNHFLSTDRRAPLVGLFMECYLLDYFNIINNEHRPSTAPYCALELYLQSAEPILVIM